MGTGELEGQPEGRAAVTFFVFLLLTVVVARVTRLIVEDAILNEPRQWLLRKIWMWRKADDVHESSWTPPYLRRKIHYLLTCPWCSSLYVSAGAIGLTYLFTDVSLPLPVFWWPGLAMTAVMCLEYTDGVKQAEVTLKQKK